MSITVNLYYRGENGSARAFAREMEEGGTADKIRAENFYLFFIFFNRINNFKNFHFFN